MKKIIVILTVTVCLTPGWGLSAQDIPGPIHRTDHYEIQGMDMNAAAYLPVLGRELEARFMVYNQTFHFNPEETGSPMKVKVWTNQDVYDRYMREKESVLQSGVVYLHYTTPEKRELCISWNNPDRPVSMSYHAFIQYFRYFIPNPPVWMRDGFGIYFNTLRFDPSVRGMGEQVLGVLSQVENLDFLDQVKQQGKEGPSIQSVLRGEAPPAQISDMAHQAVSWALVSFFQLSGRQDYYRTLTDAFMVLSPRASTSANTQAVADRILLFCDLAVLEKDYRAYLDSRKTFTDLMEDGRRAYEAGDFATAEKNFVVAREIRPGDPASYYYLGLLAYEKKDYAAAERFYELSLSQGVDQALVYYALGMNAAAAGKDKEAAAWLEKAEQADPVRYGTLVGEFLQRLR